MKTLVLFETHEGLLAAYLSDLPLPPAEGRQYVFDGKRYQVSEIIEWLGARSDDGTVKNPYQKLLDLLTAFSGDSQAALAQLARVTDIGTANLSGQKRLASGLIVVGEISAEFDHLVFVRLKSLSKKAAARTTLKLAQFVNLVAPPARDAVTGGGGTQEGSDDLGDEDIVLGER